MPMKMTATTGITATWMVNTCPVLSVLKNPPMPIAFMASLACTAIH